MNNYIKEIEAYFLVLSYMFIGFFIVVTGVTLLPLIVESSREGSLVPLFYTLSIMFGFVYLEYYKVVKQCFKEDKK